jgi:hypothetical protein
MNEETLTRASSGGFAWREALVLIEAIKPKSILHREKGSCGCQKELLVGLEVAVEFVTKNRKWLVFTMSEDHAAEGVLPDGAEVPPGYQRTLDRAEA